MSELVRVLILDSMPESRQLLATMLGFDPGLKLVGQAPTSGTLFTMLESDQADVILVSDPIQDEEMPKVIWQITSRAPQVGVIVISAEADPDLMRRSMVAGARGFIVRPLDSHELRRTIHEVYTRIAEERRIRVLQMTPSTGPLDKDRAPALGHMVAVTGAKGGVGKTTISVNLAVALRQVVRRDVALVDGDLSLGDAGLYLDLTPVHSILDLRDSANDGESLDPELVKGVMARYEPLGLRVLLSPPRPEHAELVTAEHIRHILEVLKRLFDYVVVDCAVGYDERLLTILDHASQIFFVVTPEVGPLKNARNFLDLSETLGYSRDRVKIVLNRADSQVNITPEDVQRWLAYPIAHRVVSGGAAVTAAANRGKPLVLHSPQHPVSRDIQSLVDVVVRTAGSATGPLHTARLR